MKINTCDEAELRLFKELSSTWWDERGPFRILHSITPLRMAFIKEKVGLHFHCSETSLKPFQGLRILDVGSGGGLLCEPLARLGAEVTGIDPIQENIKVAKLRAETLNLPITYYSCAIEDLSQDLPLFDVIIASEIVEHVSDLDGFLKVCLDHLAPKGGMVVTTFNKTLRSYLFGIVIAEHLLKWAPRGTHSWEKFVSPQNLSRKFSCLGLGSQEITGLQFSPLACEWRLSCSTEVNYFMWAARF